jgi:hypothetical protein
MIKIAIDKNVPMPKKTPEKYRYIHYPWEWMNVGDSFLVPLGKIVSLFTSVDRMNKKGPYKYKMLLDQDGDYRVWRVK